MFARLDALPQDGLVREFAGLDDGQVAWVLARSHGLLMLSHAEFERLPLTEAAGRGIPVLSAPLASAQRSWAITRAGCRPTIRAWAGAVALLAGAVPLRLQSLAVRDWDTCFVEINEVLRCKVAAWDVCV